MKRSVIKFLTGAIMYLAAFQPQKALAQARIHGSVLDKNKRPVAMANVLLLQAKDSTLIRGMVTTVSGAYSFMNVPAGTYIISASFVGYRQASTAPFPIRDIPDDKDMGTIELPWEDKQLDKVTIIAKKPLFEQTIDRLTINVENSITAAGSTALDILERSPGIVVDLQNAVLSMNGKNSVVVMINGKINHMPISAVIQMLAGMNSGNIGKIELITTPPASLDAE
ncbi:MAG TPA: carboxypeptidase-like regulatory domain-containing protein, partial [Puia sp.]|nr:carboxypeptidase-like regulatory domain-containing protein [Puia sp.]